MPQCSDSRARAGMHEESSEVGTLNAEEMVSCGAVDLEL